MAETLTPYDPESALTPAQAEHIAKLKDVETAMLAFAEDWRYPMTLPRGPKGERAIVLLNYLIPDLQHILAAHFIQRGWRRHDDLAVIKPRRVIGGILDDLVTYVGIDESDEPIVVQKPYVPDAEPPKAPGMDAMPWRVKPVLTEEFEERPADDIAD